MVAQVSFTDLRQNMARYFDRVTGDREALLVTRQGGKGNVVILSEAEFSGWQETVRLLSSPRNADRLRSSIRALDAGQGQAHELIEDEGPGAPPDVVPTLFEAFVRATPDGQGFGLGLAIAQRAVNAHGGTIVARNRTPNGLSVAIALPAAQMVSA